MAKTVTPSQAARRLGVNATTFRRWITGGHVTPSAIYNVGTKEHPRYRVEVQEIERIKREGLLDGSAPTWIAGAEPASLS